MLPPETLWTFSSEVRRESPQPLAKAGRGPLREGLIDEAVEPVSSHQPLLRGRPAPEDLHLPSPS
jgi:hypothetical protein